VPKGLVQEILAAGGTVEAGGQRRELTLMFTDVENFTTLSEAMDPAALMRHISAYFETMGGGIARHRGVVDKYIGDAVMAFWNAPHLDPEHVAHACAAALECRMLNEEINARAREQDLPALRTRFGVHSGPVVVGNIGGAERMNYTAVGASVNIASRLEGLNKVYGTQVLVSEAVRAQVGDRFLFRSIDRVLPKGAVHPLEISELMGALPGNGDVGQGLWADDRAVALAAAWEEAYGALVARDWGGARASFEDVMRQFPEDKPAALYAERCGRFMSDPPPASWDGVTRHEQK
jgi:adenylate cyclase